MERTWVGTLGRPLVGHEVLLKGWVHRVRDHGGILFLELRDRSGLVQVVVGPQNALFDQAQSLRPESVVALQGQVVARSPETVNDRLATGEVEVQPSSLEVLSVAEAPPIRATEEGPMDEAFRLRYRYLDLRREGPRANIMLRHRLAQAIRAYLNDRGFIDIETPVLTRSTPEGARDFLVPSRLERGSFYALPQSPQLFKQLLMVAGFERYYQLVRCFRDEDLRADRQPEFTQVDIEMSFVDRRDVMDLAHGMIGETFSQVCGWQVPETFTTLSYDEAMLRFGTDAPDLRFGLELEDVTDWARTGPVPFMVKAAQERGVVRALLVEGAAGRSRKEIETLAAPLDRFGLRPAWLLRQDGELKGSLARFFPEGDAGTEVPEGALKIFICGPKDKAEPAAGALRSAVAESEGLIAPGTHAFCWVTDFPLFSWSEEEERWVSVHHPFTAPVDEDVPLLSQHPERVRSKAYDMVLDGREIGGGSIRIHRRDVQEAVFKVLGLTGEEAQDKFGFLLEAFRFGAPPHGGIAFGYDRMVMLLAGAQNLREVIPFPKLGGADPLTGAPARVAKEQLDEVGVEVRRDPSESPSE